MKITKSRINTLNFIMTESIRINNDLVKAIEDKSFKEFHKREYGEGVEGFDIFINSPNDYSEKYKSDPRVQIKLSNRSRSAILHMLKGIIKEDCLGMHLTINELYKDFKESFYNHIFIDKGELDYDGCSKILNNTVNNVTRKFSDEDFYFPILVHGLGNEVIDLGIASIQPKDIIFSQFESKFDANIVDYANEFFNAQLYPYKHLLKITIRNCSKERRNHLSKQLANFIVGIIQIFSEHYGIDPDILALSINPYPNYKSFHITNDSEGYNYNFSSKGTIAFSSEFWERFRQDNSFDIGEIIKQIIIRAANPKPVPLLLDRLIDAIFIFRSAMQDNDESSSVVKMTTALERLVNTRKENISATFRKRVVLLMEMYHKEGNDWNKVVREMYQYRSSIVHGSWSLYRQVEPLYIKKYSELTSKAILSACIAFSQVGLKRQDDVKVIDSLYDYLSKNQNP